MRKSNFSFISSKVWYFMLIVPPQTDKMFWQTGGERLMHSSSQITFSDDLFIKRFISMNGGNYARSTRKLALFEQVHNKYVLAILCFPYWSKLFHLAVVSKIHAPSLLLLTKEALVLRIKISLSPNHFYRCASARTRTVWLDFLFENIV